MSVDQYEQSDLWEMATGTRQLEEWLATTVRGLLWSWVGNAEPSPATWTRLKERLLRLHQRRRPGLVGQVISEAASHSAARTSDLEAISQSNGLHTGDRSRDSSRS